MDKKPLLLAILVIFGFTACATMESDVKKEPPLPNALNSIPPGPSAFTGDLQESYLAVSRR